jgi:hypothetical protein
LSYFLKTLDIDKIKAFGKVVDFDPDGTAFDTPVTIRIPYTEEDLFDAGVSDLAELRVWTFNTDTLTCEAIPVDAEEGFLTYQTNHFSIFAVGLAEPEPTEESAAATAPSGGSGDGGGGGRCFIATTVASTLNATYSGALCEFGDASPSGYLWTTLLLLFLAGIAAGFLRQKRD